MDCEPWRSKKAAVLSLGLDAGEKSEVGEEVRMRLATLLSLGLNRRHEDEGGEDGGSRSRRAQALRHTCNQGAEDVAVQSPRQHETSNGHRRYIEWMRPL